VQSPDHGNRLPQERSIGWFERLCTHPVPWTHQGHGREVYPGFLQLAGFIGMNLEQPLARGWPRARPTCCRSATSTSCSP
jgi:poly-beta-hydroxyalkanoate depolymerase